ncbi:MAG: hypothetical protein IV100_31850 [Myxococcales bacterium]|nr:hypothetical protein [Myxococcales bacterium]
MLSKLTITRVAIAALCAGSATAFADEPTGGFRGGVQTAFYDSYYFRGFSVFDQAFNLQPSLDLGYAFGDLAVLNFNAWAAVPFEQRDALEAVRDEVDLTLDATFTPVAGLALSVGAVVYILPTDPVFHTEELYVVAAYSFDFGLTLKVGAYGDLNEFKGVYTRGAAVYTVAMTDRLSFTGELFASGTTYADVDSAFTEIGAQVGVSADLGSNLSTTFSVLYNYNDSIDKHLYAIGSSARYAF